MRQFIAWCGIAVSMVACLAFGGEPSLGPGERAKVQDALSVLGMSEKDLSFEKKWAVDSLYRLPIIDRLLDQPLDTPGYTDSSAEEVSRLAKNPPQILPFLARQVNMGFDLDSARVAMEIRKKAPSVAATFPSADIPPGMRQAAQLVLASFEMAEIPWKEAFSKLSRPQVDLLLMAAPILWSDEDDSLDDTLKGILHREFRAAIDTSAKVEFDSILSYSRRVDRKALCRAGYIVALGTALAAEELGGLKPEDVPRDLHIETNTRWGRVALGGPGTDTYQGSYSLIIDCGGQDRYLGRAGGAVGFLGNPFGVVIDLGGDDIYESELTFNQGGATFGVGVLYDLGGDDVYRGSHGVQGAGLWGVGLLYDRSGADFMSGGFFTQGSGHFGLGVLVEGDGNDTYRSYDWTQGFGSTWGYGLLADLGGNDVYYAGGKYIHHPLLPTDYRSFSQGFGMGYRPDAGGGIGFLYEAKGNDFYCGDVFTQGTSYWYSLGMLVDEEGNDRYTAGQYSQGAGIHLSIGSLIDRGGDDQYVSKYGPSQGEGHDFSVGVLIDKVGLDFYYASGGQGIGLTNSVGLFIGSDGNTAYSTLEGDFGQGTANLARGFGGVGIFVDLGGQDTYPQRSRGKDQASWVQGTMGAGIDVPGARKEEEWPELKPDSIPGPVDKVFKEASMWEVREAIPRVRKARKELVALGTKAIDYVMKEKIGTKDGLEQRAIEELAKAYPDSMMARLIVSMDSSSLLVRANSVYLLGQTKKKETVPHLVKALKRKDNRPRWALNALGEIGDTSGTLAIIPYLQDQAEPVRIPAANALGRIKDPRCVKALLPLLDAPLVTVRMAAEQALAAMPDSAARPLVDLVLAGKPERGMIHALRGLGSIAAALDTAKARTERVLIRRALISRIADPSRNIRWAAIESLGRYRDEETRKLLQARLVDEVDPFVLRKLQQVLE